MPHKRMRELSIHTKTLASSPQRLMHGQLTLSLAAFKTYRKLRRIDPAQTIIETIKIIYVAATKILVKNEYYMNPQKRLSMYRRVFRKFM